jgi:putative SOS response-associated peptidase YedK
MCGRFSATFTFREIRLRWNIDVDGDFSVADDDFSLVVPRFNIAPSQSVAVITNDHGTRGVKQMQWGLVPAWAKDPAIGNQMINARAETLTDRASFKDLVDRRRCVIPASGFYEWRKDRKQRMPMWFHLKSKEPFAFAGLWDRWRKPDGNNLETFTIITTGTNDLVRPIHDRMPVILQREDEEQWLDSAGTSFNRASSVLKPYPAEQMNAYDVSLAVNKPEFDGPECIQPVSDCERLSAGQLSLF